MTTALHTFFHLLRTRTGPVYELRLPQPFWRSLFALVARSFLGGVLLLYLIEKYGRGYGPTHLALLGAGVVIALSMLAGVTFVYGISEARIVGSFTRSDGQGGYLDLYEDTDHLETITEMEMVANEKTPLVPDRSEGEIGVEEGGWLQVQRSGGDRFKATVVFSYPLLLTMGTMALHSLSAGMMTYIVANTDWEAMSTTHLQTCAFFLVPLVNLLWTYGQITLLEEQRVV